jgi:hypothetical protein
LCISQVRAESFSRERQIEIIANFMYVTGQSSRLPSDVLNAVSVPPDGLPVKCGTPAVLEFIHNRDRLDKDLLLSLGVAVQARPSYAPDPHYTYDSPSGRFKVHYTTSGPHAVYRSSADNDGDGVPNYVESVAMILDSVYVHIMDTLQYPPPPQDGFYPSGGDDRYDVYLIDIDTTGVIPSGVAYGLTFPDSLWVDDATRAVVGTSVIWLENDFQESAFGDYNRRPLDAVRVTCAHEFFHAVQFGMDVSEFEGSEGIERRYWMEMSSTWMEEEVYDDINDYYTYLPYFYLNPRKSLQQFGNYHEYGSVVFPIFLSEKFGRDIIKDIWELCGSMGAGPHFLIAADSALRVVSGGVYDWPKAFQEFVLWNYFTGERACVTPPGIGYSEGKEYPLIPDVFVQEVNDSIVDTIILIDNHTEYPVKMLANENPRFPEHNAATYVRFDHMRAIMYETFWNCDSGSFDDICYDSSQVFDTTAGYDKVIPEDSLTINLGLVIDRFAPSPPQPWGLTLVYQMDSIPDSFLVDKVDLGPPPWYNKGYVLKIINPNQYRTITMIVSPATYDRSIYQDPQYPFGLGYSVPELLDSARIDTPIIIDSELVNLPAVIFAPYPNPAVVARMGDAPLTFKFQIPTDSFSNIPYRTPYFSVDIFNVAGEFVNHVASSVSPICHEKVVEFQTEWDMKNEAGREVASGVYIAVARLYSAPKRGVLLAEDKVKVAIIR